MPFNTKPYKTYPNHFYDDIIGYDDDEYYKQEQYNKMVAKQFLQKQINTQYPRDLISGKTTSIGDTQTLMDTVKYIASIKPDPEIIKQSFSNLKKDSDMNTPKFIRVAKDATSYYSDEA